MTARRLAIQVSDCGDDVKCAVCGNEDARLVGPELFEEGSGDAVCWPCGYDIAPDLVALLIHAHGITDLHYAPTGSDDASVLPSHGDPAFLYTPGSATRLAGVIMPDGATWYVADVMRGWIAKGGDDPGELLAEWRDVGLIDADGDDNLAWRVIDGDAVRVVAWRHDSPTLGGAQDGVPTLATILEMPRRP
jgi:hypothetical protein